MWAVGGVEPANYIDRHSLIVDREGRDFEDSGARLIRPDEAAVPFHRHRAVKVAFDDTR